MNNIESDTLLQLMERVGRLEDRQNKLVLRLGEKLKEYEQRISNVEYETKELGRRISAAEKKIIAAREKDSFKLG